MDRARICLILSAVMIKIAVALCLFAMPALFVMAMAQNPTFDFVTPDFSLKLDKTWQTIAALETKGAGGFDFWIQLTD